MGVMRRGWRGVRPVVMGDAAAPGGFWAAVSDCRADGVRAACVGRVPACQSRKICSSRAKTRAKRAANRVCRAADSGPPLPPKGADVRKLAKESASGVGLKGIQKIYWNL